VISRKTILLVLALVVAVGVTVPAAALARSANSVLCEEPFTHIPAGKASKTLTFKMVALNGKSMVATSCKRGQAVIQTGFNKFGKKTLSYKQVGKLKVVIHTRTYTFAMPQPVASGSYAWTGAGTRIQYSLPTGP